jgi:hypothetical protein
MRLKRRKRSETPKWALVAGAALTGAVALYGIARLMRSSPVRDRLDLRALEKRVVQALLRDEATRSQGIDISAVGSGVVEVSGAVATPAEARYIVDLIDGVPGVHAVLNRLEIRSVESKLKTNRSKNDGETPRWYGGSVGIGKRRQSFATDPGRRDDRADLLSKSLQPNRDDVLTDVEEMEGTGVRIGLTNSTALNTHVQPHSPDPSSDEPGPPPEVAPHEMAQRE